jgi:hypothetical protein
MTATPSLQLQTLVRASFWRSEPSHNCTEFNVSLAPIIGAFAPYRPWSD